jgi:hypothetical protein
MTCKSPEARNVPTTSTDLDFSLVLARVIGSIENDPAQLRNVVYELARIKLEREVWQRQPPLSMTEIRNLMRSLDIAIKCVESVSLRHDESRALRSLDRLIESSGTRPHHPISNERASGTDVRPIGPRDRWHTRAFDSSIIWRAHSPTGIAESLLVSLWAIAGGLYGRCARASRLSRFSTSVWVY